MLNITPGLKRLLLAAAVLALVENCLGQRGSNWRIYKLADGLPESSCISVTVSPQGKILARHANTAILTELDGYTATSITSPENARGRVYQSPGGQLWTAVPKGLQEYTEGLWRFRSVPQVGDAYPFSARVLDPVPLYPVRQGLVILMLQDSLLEFNGESPSRVHTVLLRSAAQSTIGEFAGMVASRDGGLWVTGARGLAKIPGPLRNLKPETPWQEFLPPASLQLRNLQAPHENEHEGITNVTALADTAAPSQKSIVEFDGQHWNVTSPTSEKLRQAWHGPDESRWAMRIDALLQWQPDRPGFVENEEISARQYYDVAVEPSGNFWLTTSDGLFRYAPVLWRIPVPLRTFNPPVRCLAADSDGRIWFVTGTRLCSLWKDQLRQYSMSGPAEFGLQSRAIFILKSGVLLLAAQEAEPGEADKLFKWNPQKNSLDVVETPGGQFKALGMLKDGSLCVQISDTNDLTDAYSLAKYDGQNIEPLPEGRSAPSLGESLNVFYAARNGDLWLGGERGTACYRDSKWSGFATGDKSMPEHVLAFTELANGTIWCATSEQIWEFDGRNWSSTRRGFDRISSLLRSGRDSSVWVSSNSGLHRYSQQGAWIEYGVEEGLPSPSVRELCEDQRGQLWAATAHGLCLFHAEADFDPPRTSVQQANDTRKRLPENSIVNLTFSAQDKWKYTPPDRLLYSYRLDQHDWSEFSGANHVSLSDLPAGKHYFEVRSMDRNCNIDPNPAQLEFAIVLPWYKETRLVLISAAGVCAALFFAGLAFNRHRQLSRSYAEIEKKVTERTQQLEVANRELLHSQKMNALGTLAAGIAHDFNNILSIIKGSAQLIEDNLDKPDKIRTRADRIRTAVDQGAGIVKAMLGFSRDSGEAASFCNINTVVEDTLRLLGDRFLREVQVSFQPVHSLPEILTSSDFIQQILLNLIFNAAESMQRNPEIVLRTHLIEKLPSELVLLPESAPAYVGISVQDFGCGISMQNLQRIFEPFFTTKAFSTRRGTGLGLSMVYELAKRLGAGLAVDSAVDQGSTFTLFLPVRTVARKVETV